MLKQTIDGLTGKTLTFKANSDEDALIAIMGGKVEKYELKSTGGSELNQTPAVLNRKSFIVSKETSTGRLSAMVRIPHVKETFYFNELVTAVKGNFDASFESDVKCDVVKMNFDKLA